MQEPTIIFQEIPVYSKHPKTQKSGNHCSAPILRLAISGHNHPQFATFTDVYMESP